MNEEKFFIEIMLSIPPGMRANFIRFLEKKSYIFSSSEEEEEEEE